VVLDARYDYVVGLTTCSVSLGLPQDTTVGDTLQLGPWDVRILLETTATTA